MADEEEVPQQEVAEPIVVPDAWQLADQDKVGKLVKLLQANPDTFIETMKQRHPFKPAYHTLLLWASVNGKFTLVEYLLSKVKEQPSPRDVFALANEKDLEAFDKIWKMNHPDPNAEEEEEEPEEEEEEEEPEPEAEAEEGEEPAEPKPPKEKKKKDPLEKLAKKLEMSPYRVKEIAALGVYEGERSPETRHRHGLGTVLFPNGDLYCGQYVNGVRQGKGTYFYSSNKSLYTGDFENNMKQGSGRAIYPDGTRYYGKWVNNLPEGQGVYTYQNGDQYIGSWVKGRRQGKGVYKFADDQSEYAGDWVDDQCVNVTWNTKCGLSFAGKAGADGLPVGEGVFTFPSSDTQQFGAYNSNHIWMPSHIIQTALNTEADQAAEFEAQVEAQLGTA